MQQKKPLSVNRVPSQTPSRPKPVDEAFHRELERRRRVREAQSFERVGRTMQSR